MEFIIKEYVKNLKEKDIIDYATKEGITLKDEETKVIYMYIKNYWQVFLKDDPTYLFEELKDKLEAKTYQKVIELYNKYKRG